MPSTKKKAPRSTKSTVRQYVYIDEFVAERDPNNPALIFGVEYKGTTPLMAAYCSELVRGGEHNPNVAQLFALLFSFACMVHRNMVNAGCPEDEARAHMLALFDRLVVRLKL